MDSNAAAPTPSSIETQSRSAVNIGWRAALARRVPSTRGLAFAIVYVIWGSTYLAIRVGVTSIPPLLLSGVRFLVAGSVLYAWQRRRVRTPTRVEWQRAAISGLVLLAGGNGLVTLAETNVPSNVAALMIAGVPAYVALLDWWRPGGSRPRRRVLAGVLLGSLGMALLVRPGHGEPGPTHWYGVAALVLAGWCWAAGSLYTRHRPQHPSSALAGAQQMIAGGSALLLLGIGRGELGELALERITAESLIALAYMTIFGSMIAFSAFNWLASRVHPAELATTAYVNPVVALVLGWVVLGETLSPISLAGAASIVAAVIVMLAPTERAAARPSRAVER